MKKIVDNAGYVKIENFHSSKNPITENKKTGDNLEEDLRDTHN